MQLKILHVINNYSWAGGAEKALSNILKDPTHSHVLQCLGSLDSELFDLTTHVPRVILLPPMDPSRSKSGLLSTPRKLVHVIRKVEPDLIAGWMYTPNIVLALALKFGRIDTPLIWNIRHSLDNLKGEPPRTWLAIRISALLSKSPQVITYNSRRSLSQHESIGFNRSGRYLPNGIDMNIFNTGYLNTDRSGRSGAVDIRIGTLGRNHPTKNHAALIRCAKTLAMNNSNFTIIIKGLDTNLLMDEVRQNGMEDHVSLEAQEGDVTDYLRSLDVFVLPSLSEGFPNALAEAMATGLYCIANDVGECASIVGQHGVVVERGNEAELARAIQHGMDKVTNRKHSPSESSAHITANFSLTNQIAQFNQLCVEASTVV